MSNYIEASSKGTIEASSEGTAYFRCAGCSRRVKAPHTAIGQKGKCPVCKTLNLVPAPAAAAMLAQPELAKVGPPVSQPATPPIVPIAATPGEESVSVPFKVGLPQKLGGVSVETTVSRKGADMTIAVIVGGLLVALGVVLVVIFPPLAPVLIGAGARRWKGS